MSIQSFQLNNAGVKYAKPQCGLVALMHVIISTTRASRLEGAGIIW